MNIRVDEVELIGTYFQSHGLGGSTLKLFADHRFSAVENADIGELSRDEGTWRLEGDTFVLQPEPVEDRKGRGGVNVRFLPIKWGKWFLLIDEYWMPEFCVEACPRTLPRWAPIGIPNYIKTSERPCHPAWGVLQTRAGRHARRIYNDLHELYERLTAVVSMWATRGAQIPDRFRDFYENGPVHATVREAGEDGMLSLTSGTMERLRPGMRMALWQPETIDPKFGIPRNVGERNDRLELVIESVGEREASAKVRYFWNSVRSVAVGDRFTTGEDWFSVAGTGVPRFDDLPPLAERYWTPPSLGIEELSAGLRTVLTECGWADGPRSAIGASPGSTASYATLHDGRVYLESVFDPLSENSRVPLWSEPDDTVWSPLLPNQKPLKLPAVSEELRTALGEARWPNGSCLVVGTAPDGTRYYASERDDLIYIYEQVAPNAIRIPLPEPEGVVWQPVLTVREPVRLAAVSAGLRKALADGKWPEGDRRFAYYAKGGGPDGTQYRAHVWHGDVVVIDFADEFLLTHCGFVEVKPDDRLRSPRPECHGRW